MGKSVRPTSAMRTSLISLFIAFLVISTAADEFEDEKIKVGKKMCTCSFDLIAAGTKLSPKSRAACDKKCSGLAKGVSLTGESGVFSFDMSVKKGKAKLMKGLVVPASTGSGSGPMPPTGSGSGPLPTTGSGSGPMPPIGSGSGSIPPTGSGSGPMPPIGSGSGPLPPTGPGSGSGPMPPNGEGMQCSCKCNCPGNGGEWDCNCDCPNPTSPVSCASGFTQVCPMMDGMCPNDMMEVCIDGMPTTMRSQNRMYGQPQGCQCVPDFLMALGSQLIGQAQTRSAAPEEFKGEAIKVGKRNCKCNFLLFADGTDLGYKSKGNCDKKCSGVAKGVELEGDSGNVYTFDMKAAKGKVTFLKGSVAPAAGSSSGSGIGGGPGSGMGSGPISPPSNPCICVGSSSMSPGPMPGSGSGPIPGPMPGSGSGSEVPTSPGSGSGSSQTVTIPERSWSYMTTD